MLIIIYETVIQMLLDKLIGIFNIRITIRILICSQETNNNDKIIMI